MPIGRLAPSPTGAQHLGNARTYLLAFWSARRQNARLILRIEDINSPRVKPWATQQATDDLHWLGIDWDEGPDVGGPNAPYIQTEREESYQQALQSLIDRGLVYPCTCSRKDIAAAADAPHADDHITVYPGTCATWQLGDPLPTTGTYCWRFRTRSEPIELDDRMAGRITRVPGTDLGDFPVTRKTGEPAYQLAVVVDDIGMGVTEVVRGDDLLTSTFWQLELYDALDATPPRFAHVPLVVGADGHRLAKRHGDTRLSHYRQQGVTSRQVIAWAARSAGLAGLEESPSHADLIERFSWDRITRGEVVVDAFP